MQGHHDEGRDDEREAGDLERVPRDGDRAARARSLVADDERERHA